MDYLIALNNPGKFLPICGQTLTDFDKRLRIVPLFVNGFNPCGNTYTYRSGKQAKRVLRIVLVRLTETPHSKADALHPDWLTVSLLKTLLLLVV
jgi:hypothetical protein